MAVRLIQSSASPRFASTALHPSSWAFTMFIEFAVDVISTNGTRIISVENSTSPQRVGLNIDASGNMLLNNSDTGLVVVTATMFTDASIGSRGKRVKACLVSTGGTGTTAAAFHVRDDVQPDVVKTTLTLGTMSLAPEEFTLGGIFTGGGSNATWCLYNFLSYDQALSDAEVALQMRAGNFESPIWRNGLTAWCPFPAFPGASAYNVVGANLTVTGTPDATLDDSLAVPSWRRNRDRVVRLAGGYTPSGAPPVTNNALFFGMGV